MLKELSQQYPPKAFLPESDKGNRMKTRKDPQQNELYTQSEQHHRKVSSNEGHVGNWEKDRGHHQGIRTSSPKYRENRFSTHTVPVDDSSEEELRSHLSYCENFPEDHRRPITQQLERHGEKDEIDRRDH